MVNLKYNQNLYRKDYTRYVLYQRKVYLIVSSIAVSVGIVFFIIDNFSSGLPESTEGLKPYIYILAGSAAFSVIRDLGSLILNIRKSSKQLPTEPQTLAFKPQRIELGHFGNPIVIFVRDLKGYKTLGGTVFLVSQNKKSWPIRINPKEVSSEGMSFLMGELKQLGLKEI